MFYDIFIDLCNSKNVSPSRAALDMKLNKSTVTRWKNDPDLVPKGDTLQKIADYFGVSVDYLLTGQNTQLEKLMNQFEIDEGQANQLMSEIETISKNGSLEFKDSLNDILAQQKIPQPEAEGFNSIEVRADRLLSGLLDTKNETIMLDGKPASPEAIEAFRKAIEMGVAYARQVNDKTNKG